jgi:perosamine synthetase
MKRYTQKQIDAVVSVLKSGDLSLFFGNFLGGGKVREFEKNFAEYHGVKHAVSTTSGTTALHTALLACGIGLGDEVITTPYTFVASASSILMCGARPIFVDVDELTYNIDPAKILQAARRPNVKAILPVHLLGHPADMEQITDIANHYKLFIIEDCAQALGAKTKKRLVGGIGDIGCFSFQQTKTITTGGEGGMLITNDDDLATRAQWIRNHGEKYADAPILGYNYRLTEMQAALGIEELKRLDYLNNIQIRNAKYLCNRLPKGITPPFQHPYTEPVYFLIGAQYNEETVGVSREEYIKRLKEKGLVQGQPGMNVSGGYNKLIFEHSVLQPYQRTCPIAEDLLKTSLWIDLHRFGKTLEDMKSYAHVFKEVLD